jgi:hypothetical protein
LGQEKDQPLPLRPCTRPGFTEPTPLDVAGALLPHLCTLTEERRRKKEKRRRKKQYSCSFFSLLSSLFSLAPAVFFCGTILTIARTGRYPASLVFRVPGLSSRARTLATASLTLLTNRVAERREKKEEGRKKMLFLLPSLFFFLFSLLFLRIPR